MVSAIKFLVYRIFSNIIYGVEFYRSTKKKEEYNFDKSVDFVDVEFVGPNIEIGKRTYINKGSTISSGLNSRVKIGKYCAIGRYTHISSKTHALELPTPDEEHFSDGILESDVIIGDYVWIGDKVFIKEGIAIGNYAIVAANSVVNRDILPFEIVGGVPIRHIRFNEKHYKYNSLKNQIEN